MTFVVDYEYGRQVAPHGPTGDTRPAPGERYWNYKPRSEHCSDLTRQLDAVAESEERGFPVRKGRNSNPSRVKPIRYNIDSCHYLAWQSALIG